LRSPFRKYLALQILYLLMIATMEPFEDRGYGATS
jgi:hypothetical protein